MATPEGELTKALTDRLSNASIMAWFYLTMAIIFEVLGTTCMKLSNAFSNLVPSILMLIFYLFSFLFLTFSLKRIDVSIAYAVWAGIGIALITCMGILLFKEPITVPKIFSIVLIIAGVIGLNLSGNMH